MNEIEPENGLSIKNDVMLKSGSYFLPRGMIIDSDGITLDGNGALIIGDFRGKGITILNKHEITIRNLRISSFYHGIHAQDCENITLDNCQITNTYEVTANSEFLDIWRSPEQAYGAGIMLHRVSDSYIRYNDLQHQMNGILSYYCNNILVEGNIANYCSGWGYHLFETCNSSYINNYADFCCRYEPRPGRGWNFGHLGADAAGFLLVHKSCRNIFKRNLARMSGDGFFLAGMTPKLDPVGCDDNLFEENDGSFSPNNAFESTFSKGNIFRKNFANRCNYGFWLGFSSDGLLEDNDVNWCSQAGIACENGSNFILRTNAVTNNNHGLLIWSKMIKEIEPSFPKNHTSHDWLIEGNSFINNNKAIRIAADQDHGIRNLPESGELGYPALKPYDHVIRKNLFSKNAIEVELVGVDQISVDDNEYQ